MKNNQNMKKGLYLIYFDLIFFKLLFFYEVKASYIENCDQNLLVSSFLHIKIYHP